MNLPTIKAVDFGMHFNSGDALALGREFHWGGVADTMYANGAVFIDSDGGNSKGEHLQVLNVVLQFDDKTDSDHSDINDFRQYTSPVISVVAAVQLMENMVNDIGGRSLNYIDRLLINTLGFTRII